MNNKALLAALDRSTPAVGGGICYLPEEYVYSSVDYYELNKNKWDFKTNYDE